MLEISFVLLGNGMAGNKFLWKNMKIIGISIIFLVSAYYEIILIFYNKLFNETKTRNRVLSL